MTKCKGEDLELDLVEPLRHQIECHSLLSLLVFQEHQLLKVPSNESKVSLITPFAHATFVL